jgi:hypothetical protein
VGMSGEMLCSFLLLEARFVYFGRGFFSSLDSGSRLVLVFRRRISFDIACHVRAMLTWQEA